MVVRPSVRIRSVNQREIGVVVTTKSGVCQGWASAVLLQYSNNVMWIRARYRWWTRKPH